MYHRSTKLNLPTSTVVSEEIFQLMTQDPEIIPPKHSKSAHAVVGITSRIQEKEMSWCSTRHVTRTNDGLFERRRECTPLTSYTRSPRVILRTAGGLLHDEPSDDGILPQVRRVLPGHGRR